MGVDAADYDQDGWLDLFVTNVDHEQYSLYHNNKDETFSDAAPGSGIAAATKMLSGWGVKFFDCDNDGNADLLLCNGHPDLMVEQRLQNVGYREKLLLFQNEAKGWKNLSAESGPVFSQSLVSYSRKAAWTTRSSVWNWGGSSLLRIRRPTCYWPPPTGSAGYSSKRER